MAKEKEARESAQQREQNQPGQTGQSAQGRSSSQAMQAPERGGTSRGLARRSPYGLSPWMGEPFEIMNRMAEEMDRIFEDFGMGRGLLTPGWRTMAPRSQRGFGQGLWSPQIEVFERQGQLCVRADLPGLKKEDVNVQITDDALTIQGERRQEQEEDREGFYRSERSYGSFFRSIPLPEGINPDDAQATFKDGVLEITMPMPPQVQQRGRQLEIK